MKDFWNTRYAEADYAYGIAPNVFFAQQLKARNLQGTALFPAEGEGRNAVFAAQNGLTVTAIDLSQAAKEKALKLAASQGVDFAEYLVGNLAEIDLPPVQFDVLVLIFAHFPPDMKQPLHHKLLAALKPKGTIIFEAFGKQHLAFNAKNPQAGGPKNESMLFSKEEIPVLFPNVTIELLEETTVHLEEGAYHRGESAVVRFVGTKL